jgi:hypothetical protein
MFIWMLHIFSHIWSSVLSGCCVCLQWFQVFFECFRRMFSNVWFIFRRMLQLLHLNVSKLGRMLHLPPRLSVISPRCQPQEGKGSPNWCGQAPCACEQVQQTRCGLAGMGHETGGSSAGVRTSEHQPRRLTIENVTTPSTLEKMVGNRNSKGHLLENSKFPLGDKFFIKTCYLSSKKTIGNFVTILERHRDRLLNICNIWD